MMKMTGGVTCWCVTLLFAVASVSAVQRLHSIDDLRRVDFGGSVPAHSLVLLYWFARTVDIDYYNDIRLSFNPGTNYGSHYFGNYEGLLNEPPPEYQYYTVGNLYQPTSNELPDYVVHTRLPYSAGNRDRIIFRVRRRVVDQVYITHHRGQSYDPNHIYQITPNLLRQIREFSPAENLQRLSNRYRSNAEISSIRNAWGSLVGLGLFLFIVGEKRNYCNDIMRLLCSLFLAIIFFLLLLLLVVKLPKV